MNGHSMRRTAVALATTLCAAAPALADDDPNPYYIGVSQSFTRDSNIYRFADPYTVVDPLTGISFPSPEPVSDTISSTGLVAGIDQPFGRQRFYASGRARYNDYKDNGELNNTSYTLTTGLDWSALDKLAGKLEYSTDENLATYGGGNTIAGFRKKNVQRQQHFVARGQYGLVGLLSLEAGYTHDTVDFSAVEYDPYDYREDGFSVGIKYRPSGALTLGAGLRTTRGKYPHRLGASGGYDELGLRRNDIDLTAEWIASGQSSLTARLSYGRQRFDDDRAADFTGATGSLNWSYRPTGKLAFNTYIARDTGQTTVSGLSFGPTGPSTITADSSRLRSVGQLRVIYDATAKIQLTGNALYVHRTLSNFALVGPRDATDNTRTLSLGLQYTPTRSLQFACNVAREVRSSSVDKPLFSTVTYPYHVNTTSCSGQFVLQ